MPPTRPRRCRVGGGPPTRPRRSGPARPGQALRSSLRPPPAPDPHSQTEARETGGGSENGCEAAPARAAQGLPWGLSSESLHVCDRGTGPLIAVQRRSLSNGPMPAATRSRRIHDVPVRMIVSYDGTANDDDALALGRMLAAAGATLSLAYVRHAHEYDPRREEIAQHDAERRLAQGAAWLADDSIAKHVVVDPSTGAG